MKQNKKKPEGKPIGEKISAVAAGPGGKQKTPSATPRQPLLKRLQPYWPGLALFALAFVVALCTYADYGIAWDEPLQRGPGLLSYNYMVYGNTELFTAATDNHGAGFELVLIFMERWLGITNSKDTFLMRHLVTHLVFLASALAGYVLVFRLFKNRVLACLAFAMLVLAPRIYAHSFFNSKDLPFLSLFLITLAVCQSAFARNKPWLFFVLGLLCGYTTSIRIMGVMLGGFLLLFLLIDLFGEVKQKNKLRTPLLNILLFATGFCSLLFLAWPYLWRDPIGNFVESFHRLAHFDFAGGNLVNGKYEVATQLPWTYFPTWFVITTPEIWLLAGFAGIVWLGIVFLKKPLQYLRNTPERNFLLYLMCFFAPIIAVIGLNSVIYDDWRHLYFIYPAFVLLAIYFLDKMLATKFKNIALGICALQTLVVVSFMVGNHPFSQVFFNNLVSHKTEYLRKNYEMEYWGCSFKQGLDHLLATEKQNTIKVACDFQALVDDNVMSLPEEQQKRIQYTDLNNADYLLTNFRTHPYDYPSYKTDYSISVLNSTIFCVYKLDKDTAKQRQYRAEDLAILRKAVAEKPNNDFLEGRLGMAFANNGNDDSAEFHYKRAIALNQADAYPFNNLGLLFFFHKNYGQAIEYYAKASKINPKDAGPLRNMGVCNYYLGKYDSAIYYANKAVAADPTYTPSYEILAYIYKAVGNQDSLKKYEAVAKRNNPGFRL